MADEAYRAVFLRIHPTGGMVLSLTTDPDGNEPRYQQQVADELGVPPLDVKVVTADTDRFGEGHGFNTSPSGGLPAAITSTTGKILAKARLLAGAALDEPPEQLQWSDGEFRTTTEPPKAATIADVAMYSLSSGRLPPGVEGGLDAQTVYHG
jgi:carbon-monoxide dehydrogenase large subunit